MFAGRYSYAPGAAKVEATLTLEELEGRFSKWLIDDYMQRVHSETGMTPKAKWESGAFLLRMPESREQLDLLLLTVAKPRRVQRDGIRFQGFRYFDLNLAGYVGEEVTIRYDPRDLAEIFVYAENEFVCRAICAELADQTVSLTSIIKTRNKRKKELQQEIKQLRLFADKHSPPAISTATPISDSPPAAVVYPKFKIKRFACDD
jgi:putative transposase